MSFKQLEEVIDNRLGLSDLPASRRFSSTGGTLQPENKKLADAVLKGFDNLNAARLLKESKTLSSEGGTVADSSIPATFERAVVREALYSLVGVQFVDADVADFSETHFIPYSYRKTTAAGANDTRRYEGQAIAPASVARNRSNHPIL